MGPAIGPLTRLLTRRLYSFIDGVGYWDTQRSLSSDIIEELQFWAGNLSELNGYAIKQSHAITKIAYTDASEHSYGGYILTKLGRAIAHSSYTTEQKTESSTYRELLAVKHVLEVFANTLRHEKILWHSDNINVARLLKSGSSKTNLRTLAISIFKSLLCSILKS